jgi:dTDP-4-amino-4,6-dideoxygalactose transaminase
MAALEQRREGFMRKAASQSEAYDRRRLSLLLNVVREVACESLTISDLGCGSGELLDLIKEMKLSNIHYVGADRPGPLLELARRKHPDSRFAAVDSFAAGADLTDLAADYVIANNLFTANGAFSEPGMPDVWIDSVAKMWRLARRGMALNLSSSGVAPETDALFHVSMDEAARVLHGLAGRNIVLRADHGPNAYTAYAYKQEVENPAEELSSGSSETEEVSRNIPVLRPLAAKRELIVPYLDRIDNTRTYSNFGPLVLELTERLSDRFGLPPGSVLGASSGTAALTGAILAEAGPATAERPLAIVPSFTFVATALAVEQCGYDLMLMDIDEETWMLRADSVRRRGDLGKIGLVVPVAPFGRHVAQEPWLDFHRDTGIPVVVDAAACFEAFLRQDSGSVGLLPTVLSFHATKTYSTGEGGAVVSRNSDCVLRSARALNFGFLGDRNCRGRGLNGKMSEYHAAVGHAELDGWAVKAMAYRRVTGDYEREFEVLGLSDRLVRAPDIASCYMLFACRTAAEAARVADGLTQDGIGHRAWYGAGIQAHQHFERVSREELPVTQDIANRLIGIPAGPTLSQKQIATVAAAVARHASNQVRV